VNDWNLIGAHKHLTVTCLKIVPRSAGWTYKIISYNVLKSEWINLPKLYSAFSVIRFRKVKEAMSQESW